MALGRWGGHLGKARGMIGSCLGMLACTPRCLGDNFARRGTVVVGSLAALVFGYKQVAVRNPFVDMLAEGCRPVFDVGRPDLGANR